MCPEKTHPPFFDENKKKKRSVKERGSCVITVRCSEARHEEMPEW
jgi:hypothetical protein